MNKRALRIFGASGLVSGVLGLTLDVSVGGWTVYLAPLVLWNITCVALLILSARMAADR